MGLKQLFVGLMLIGIFTLSIINFGINFGNINDAEINIEDDPDISSLASNQKTQLDSQVNQLNDSHGTFALAESGGDSEVLQPVTLRTISLNVLKLPQTMYNLTVGLIVSKIFGGAVKENAFIVIITLIGFILGTIATFYVFRWIRSGEVD